MGIRYSNSGGRIGKLEKGAVNGEELAPGVLGFVLRTGASIGPSINSGDRVTARDITISNPVWPKFTFEAFPFLAPNACTINRVTIPVKTAATAGNLRVAVYAANEYGEPGKLVADLGTVDVTTTGTKTITPATPFALAGNAWYLVLVTMDSNNTVVLNGFADRSLYGYGRFSVISDKSALTTPATWDGPIAAGSAGGSLDIQLRLG